VSVVLFPWCACGRPQEQNAGGLAGSIPQWHLRRGALGAACARRPAWLCGTPSTFSFRRTDSAESSTRHGRWPRGAQRGDRCGRQRDCRTCAFMTAGTPHWRGWPRKEFPTGWSGRSSATCRPRWWPSTVMCAGRLSMTRPSARTGRNPPTTWRAEVRAGRWRSYVTLW